MLQAGEGYTSGKTATPRCWNRNADSGHQSTLGVRRTDKREPKTKSLEVHSLGARPWGTPSLLDECLNAT